MTSEFSAQDLVAVLAGLMRAAKPAEFSRIAFFLGAGAPRGAGLPLADELKWEVSETIFGKDVPRKIAEGRLEDVMELFQTLGGENGYELVAQEIRRYHNQPLSYRLLADIINRGFVEIVLTTNFDLLLDNLPGIVPVKLTVVSSDEEHRTTKVPHDSTAVSKLHGSAKDPSTMRGSWTDGDILPEERACVLRRALKNFPAVFVGWAAQDPDILAVLKEVAGGPMKQRIFWVNPSPSPPIQILEVLNWFDSEHNYIPSTADDFFQMLHDHLFPTHRSDADLAEFRRIAERIQRSDHAVDRESLRQMKEKREAYRHRVHQRVLSFLRNIKNEIAPEQETWIIGGLAFNIQDIDPGDWEEEVGRLSRGRIESAHSALQIRTGGPALTFFIGNHYRLDGDEIELTAILAYHGTSKASTGTPLFPLEVWGAAECTVEWGSEASFKHMENWLEKDLKTIFLRGVEFFADLIQGKAEGSKSQMPK